MTKHLALFFVLDILFALAVIFMLVMHFQKMAVSHKEVMNALDANEKVNNDIRDVIGEIRSTCTVTPLPAPIITE